MIATLSDALFSLGITPLLVAAVALTLFALGRYRSGDEGKKPPGPWGVPLLGYAPFLGKRSHLTLAKLAEKFGQIFRMNIAGYEVVVLNDYESMRKAYVDQPDAIVGRHNTFIQDDLYHGMGVFSSEGPEWVENRRFFVKVLHDLSTAQPTLGERIADEANHLVSIIRSQGGQAWNPKRSCFASAFNVISGMAFSCHFEHSDKRLINLIDTQEVMIKALGQTGAAMIFGPCRFVWPWRQPWKLYRAAADKFSAQIETFIDEHYESYEKAAALGELESTPVRDFIDAFAKRMRTESNKTNSLFTREHLIASLITSLIAGTDTGSYSLLWAIFFLIHHPQVQRRMQAEIDEVVGRERAVTYDDRVRLPYVDASILEVQRLASVVALSGRRPLSDIMLDGFAIKKHTWIIHNIYQAHRDEKCFPEPELYKPERFLDDKGRFKSNPAFQPFALGKRNCAASAMASNELFVFVANLVHNFTFRPVEGEQLPSLDDYSTFAVLAPPVYRTCAIDRFNEADISHHYSAQQSSLEKFEEVSPALQKRQEKAG